METRSERPRAVLVAVQLPGVTDDELRSSLDELGRLGKTLGLDVVGRIVQRRTALSPAAVLGEGKLRELARATGGPGLAPEAEDEGDGDAGERPASEEATEAPGEEAGADDALAALRASVVLVDHELTPSQARHLERISGAEVLDRTSVILGIFHRHARTREARLQVEIARLGYLAPRLRESGRGRDRQGGGIGGRGAGESAMELDRRKIRDRIAELRAELARIEGESATKRKRRAQAHTVALVGYTNAGKSSLMRALTGSGVLVEDKLFATLDTTVRALQPETVSRILVSDTVGFIKKLPHDLVASFRSTLEEARDAELLLHVVDASDPAFPAQAAVTREVLAEIGADESPRLLLLNKIDRVDEARRDALAREWPDAIPLSAKQPADVAALRERIVSFFERDAVEAELLVPYARARVVAEAHSLCRVLEETHGEHGTLLRVRARPEVLARLREAIAGEGASTARG